MKRLLFYLFAAALLFPWGAKAQTRTFDLCVQLTDGTEHVWNHRSIRHIYFRDTTTLVIVESWAADMYTYHLPDIRKIYFRETTGVAEADAVRPMRLYPNPAGDFISIDNADNASYIICDVSGRLWLRGRYQGNPINVSSLQSGAYVIRIGNQTLKFTRQ